MSIKKRINTIVELTIQDYSKNILSACYGRD